MRLILLALVASMSVSNSPVVVDDPAPRPIAIATEFWPCSGTIPVFNPDGCPQPALTIDKVEPHTSAKLPPASSNCSNTIERVREELDQPKLRRENASPDKPLIIAAVDKRVDGCAVLQMHNNVNDLRPIPTLSEDRVGILPAS